MSAKRTEISAATAAAIADLRKAHEIGRAILEEHPGSGPLGSRVIKGLELDFGLNADRVREYRRFAASYTTADLDTLCQRCERHDRALGFRIVVKLMRIGDKKNRGKQEKEVIAGDWSLDDLLSEQFMTARRPKVGRKPKLPSTRDEMLVMLEGMCMRWGRLYDELSKGDSESHIGLRDLTKAVREQLKAATEAIGELETVVTNRLKKSRATKEQKGASARGDAGTGARKVRR